MSITQFSLFKRYNGNYYITYRQDGVVRWKSTKKKFKAEALQVLSEFQELLKQDVPRTTFLEFVNHYLSVQANSLRPSTIQRICLPAFNSFDRICGNKVLTGYSVRDVENFKKVRLEECSATTVNIQFRTLRAAFNAAVKWQMLVENPFSRSSQIKAPQIAPLHLTKEELKSLLEVVEEPELAELYLFAVLTGMRLGEIVNLKWIDVNFDLRQIDIRNGEDFQTKTGRNRVMPMSDAVLGILSKRHMSHVYASHVFHKNGKQLEASFVSHQFKKYIRLLKLHDKLHFHSLRHTFATWLVQGGVNIYEVQKLLGHSSVKVTEVYSHLASSELHNAVNRINVQVGQHRGRVNLGREDE